MDESLLALIANGMNNGVVSGSGANATSLASLLGAGDLNTFAQQAQANDILGQIAPVIASFRPDRTNWDLGTSFGTSLGQAFLAGALGNQSRANVAEQVKKVSSVLPSLYTDPLKTVAPEGIDATAWEGLKTAATVKNLQRQIGEQNKNNDVVRKLIEDVYGSDIAAMKEGKIEKAKINAKNEAYGFDPAAGGTGKNLNPDSPQYAINEALKKEEDAARSEIAKIPAVSQFSAMQKSLPLVKAFKDADSKSSDVGFVYNYIKSLDEGAVRGEEINMAAASNPLVQKWSSQLLGAATGQSELTPQLKNQMYNELLGAQKNVYAQALLDAQRRFKISEGRGVTDFGSVLPFDANLSFPDIQAAPAPDLKAQAAAILAQRKGMVPAVSLPGPR